MKGLIDPNSKLFALLTKLVYLMELNLCVVLALLPVVTVGAAISSMHAVLLKIYRGEEKKVAADFFQAMKSNLKNGTVLWLLFLAFIGVLVAAWAALVRANPQGAVYVVFVLLLVAVLGILYLNWALILQSRYVYSIGQCLRNALLAWMKYPGSTFVYLVSIAVPVLLCLSLKIWPIVLMFGITLPHIMSTFLYSRVFDEMEGVPVTLPKL